MSILRGKMKKKRKVKWSRKERRMKMSKSMKKRVNFYCYRKTGVMSEWAALSSRRPR